MYDLERSLRSLELVTVSLALLTACTSSPSSGVKGLGRDTGAEAANDSGGSGGSGGTACKSRPASQLSEAPGKSATASAAWSGDGYAIAWSDDRDGNPEIYFARLDAEGNKIGTDVRITDALGESAAPVLVRASNELGLAWSDERDGNTEIYFVRLDPAGTKLGAEVRVTSDPGRSEFPSLVQAGDGYAVAWNDTRDGTFQIYMARLGGSGVKVGNDIRVSSGSDLSASPSIASNSNGFGVAWHDLRGGAGLQIYFAWLDETGVRIGNEVRLSQLAKGGGTPSVAANGDAYGIAWGDSSGSGEAQWIRVRTDGTIAGSPVSISSSGNTAAFPVLVARGSGYEIAWPDGRDGDREIYLAYVDWTGNKLSEVRVSDDVVASLGPALTRSTLGYGVAWLNDPTATTGEVHFATVCHP